ncbi:MAG: dTMP kinase [Candidatus Marinimicrobia bacterium]|nr:dTMP kinase [Candidatus Neomarinimicrobiota bacterium]|tara:strand:- start:5122 stop:5748 length:627 start_codon:yes stop_codon:yes gene_type:complete
MNHKFISFEGIDGSGKSTQVKALKENLISIGEECNIFREPGGTSISEKIRSILLDKSNLNLSGKAESLLFFASRVQLLKEKISPYIDKGCFVICDRFNDSTLAYQCYGEDNDIKFFNLLTQFSIEGNFPSLTFYLDIDAEESLTRRKKIENDRIEDKGLVYLNKVRSGFLELAKRDPQRIIVINGKLQKEIISNHIWDIVKERYDIKV